MLRLCPRGVAERLLPHGLPDQIAVSSAGDLGHSLRFYPPVRADVRHSARKSPCGALFYEWKTLHALRCHWADGCHARRAWRSDPALPPDRRHRHPVGRSSDSAGVFLAHAPAGAQNIRRQWYQTDRRENCRNTRTSGSRRTCAVPAIIRRFQSTVR